MKTRRGFALALVLCFVLSLFAFGGTAYAAQGGSFGNGFSWTFQEGTGTLTVNGNGTLQLPSGASAPWAEFADSIRGLVIGEGISTIKDGVFAYLTNLNEVTLPKSMKTIETGAFSGCDNITQVHAAGSMTELTTMLRKNNVMELILDQVAQTVNAQTIAVESAAIQSTAAAAKQEAIEEGKQVKTEVINIGESTAKEITVEGNVTTEVNDISHPALQGAMAHVVRVITTNPDGNKTVKETITSLNDNSYWSESTSTLDALGREVYSEQKAVKTTDDHGKTVTSTSITKVKTQYKNESKSGIQVQETIFEETGRRMIGAVLLNDNGKRAAETMYSYETRTDEQGNQTEVLVQAKQTVNEFLTTAT